MKPLAGISVVEAYEPDCAPALRLAGAFAGRILADLGAEVIVRELPEGDQLRRMAPIVGGVSTLFAFLSAGKIMRQCSSDGSELATLLDAADGVILDDALYRAASLDELPGSSVVLSLLGRDAPAAPGSEFTVMALSGILDLVGDPDRAPLRLGGHQAAYSAGLSASTALLAALCLADRPRSMPSQPIWISVLDTMVWINWKSAVGTQLPGGEVSRQGASAEWQVVRCADGWVALVYQDSDWPALRAFIDDPRLALPDFATPEARRRHVRDLVSIIEAVLSHQTRDHIRAQALARRLPLGPVWSPDELLHDRQYMERGVFTPINPPNGTGACLVGLPVSWDGARLDAGPVPESRGHQNA